MLINGTHAATPPAGTGTGTGATGSTGTGNAGSDGHDERGPNEDRRQRRNFARPQQHVRLERLALAPVAVAAYNCVERSESPLIGTAIEHLAGEQDQPGTRAKDWQTPSVAVTQSLRNDVE